MKLFSRFIKIFFAILFAFTIFIVFMYLYAYFSPKIIIKNANKYYIYDKNDDIIYQGSSSNKWTKLNSVSKYYKDAVISIEDKNFYKHNGFDYPRIISASINNFKNKKIVEGASTISQQYIKNLYQNFNKTWSRKWKETILTLNLEVNYSKDEILEGYINTINFGQGNIGIADASQYYFNKSPSELSLEEALILAGIPKSPNNYNPVSNYDKSIERAKTVAKSMLKNNKITKHEYNNLFKYKINIYGKNNKENLNMLMYYQNAVLDELKNNIKIPEEIIQKKGIKIYTNLDIDVQKKLEESINNYMKGESMQVASIIVDPRDGSILALTGGLDYSKSQFNRAINAKRQVGSTMKPFLYYAAIENNLTSSTVFTSEISTFKTDDGKTYAPQNYANKYANKNITMAAAIALSDNIYAVKTNLFLGGDKLINTVKTSGIKAELKEIPSLPLGTIEISMIDFAQGYATLANNGIYNKLHFINRIEDSDGNLLYKYKDTSKQVLNPNYTYILSELLTSTYNNAFTDYTKPTALIIKNKLKEKYAIKTGTTNTDFWTIGYNKNKLMLTWTGYDDASDVESSKSYISKNIFADTIETVNNDENDDSWYETPENVIAIPLDAITGEETNKKDKMALFYFLKGTENINKKE